MDRSSSTTKILGLLLNWYPQRKYGTLSNFTFDRNVAAMSRCHFLHKCKTKSEAALLACFLVAATIKLFEDFCSFIRGDAIPLICDTKPDRTVSIGNANTHARAGRAVLDRIRDQIGESLIQKKAVRVDSHAVQFSWSFEFGLLLGGNRTDDIQHIGQHGF